MSKLPKPMKKDPYLLSDDELEALGVRRVISDDGMLLYEVPCCVCGRKTRTWRYSPTNAYKCVICHGELEKKQIKKQQLTKRKHEDEMAEKLGVDPAHYRRFEKGVSKFGLKYLPAIERAEQVREKFESVPEVVACIELLYIGARVIPHQAVGNYTVDFCLPDEKLVIEIDGSIYHANSDKEYRRDYALKNMLGDGWDVKHIPADAVMKDHKAFGKAMKRLLDDRRFELCV